MPNASQSKLQMETGQTVYAAQAMNRYSATVFNIPAVPLWSGRGGFEPNVKPNGLATGGAVTAAVSGTNDKVDVAALTCYLAGVLVSVSAATDVTVTRAVTTDTHIINSITITSAGAVAVVVGTDHTAFSETRGAAGGPPWIPTGSIEIAQIRLSSNTAAQVASAEIFASVGQHQERYDYPLWDEYRVGNGDLNAHVEFYDALPLIHSDDSGTTTKPKKVYAQVAAPVLTDIPLADAFKPVEVSHSSSSKPLYDEKVVGSSSRSIGQGGFTAYLKDGVTDAVIAGKDQVLTFKYFPSKYKTAYHVDQGVLGVARAFPAGDNITAACTITADQAGVDRAA